MHEYILWRCKNIRRSGETNSMRIVWRLSLGITVGAVLFFTSKAFSGDPELDILCS